MQTNVTHAAKDDEIIIRVISISTDLALSILILSLSILLFDISLRLGHFLFVFFLSVFLHVFEILLLLGVELVDEL